MLQFDFENSVGYWLILATRDMRRALEAELVPHDITLRQWEVLAWLSIEDLMTQSQLAERLGIEAPTLAGILDRMERDGWVERYGCPHDRRKKRLRATSNADAIWARTVECAYRVRAKATQGITSEELSLLKRLCDKIRSNLALEPEPITPCPEQPEPDDLNPMAADEARMPSPCAEQSLGEESHFNAAALHSKSESLTRGPERESPSSQTPDGPPCAEIRPIGG